MVGVGRMGYCECGESVGGKNSWRYSGGEGVDVGVMWCGLDVCVCVGGGYVRDREY